MERIVFENLSYRVLKADASCIAELSEFIVDENNKHHNAAMTESERQKQIAKVKAEESEYADSSIIYIVRNIYGKIVASIRTLRWDLETELPMQREFGVDPLSIIPETNLFWHIGRFAINAEAGLSVVSLFKQLMLYAITPIANNEHGYMLAEIDAKLLRVMNALGMYTHQMGKSLFYLGSETVPVYSHQSDLLSFYSNYKNMYSCNRNVILL